MCFTVFKVGHDIHKGVGNGYEIPSTNRAGRGHLGNTEAKIHMTWANYMVDS